jgi:aminomethyltransferase
MSADAPAAATLLRTALYDRHVAAGGRLVDFSGWEMPIQYRGILAEHGAVRSSVGAFDLSHMGRLYVRGEGAHSLVQAMATNDVSKLAVGRAQYSLFCRDDGGILDDIVVYNLGPEVLVVVNASNREKILAWIGEHRAANADGQATVHDGTFETAMIGFQGPDAERSLQPIVDAPIGDLRYYAALTTKIAGAPGLVARTGYTGEDGFEVIVSAADGPRVWDALLEERDGVRPVPCGLGARDTLRLEAGMPLYGHEIDEDTDPYQAGLGRVVKLEKGTFAGCDALRALADKEPRRRLIGFELRGGGVPRQGYPILAAGETVGQITSGNVSPTLGKPIGMGYVATAVADESRPIAVEIRGKPIEASIVSPPFYQHRTKRAGRPASGRSSPGG